MFAKIFSYAWRWITKPGDAAEDQLYEQKNAWIGFWIVAIFGFLYAAAAFVLWLTKFTPAFAPILPIPEDSYYLWQTLFTVPWAVVTWFLSGLVVHAWNRIFDRKSKRRLADILGLLGPASVIPWVLFTWLPEITVAPILGPWGFPPWPMWGEYIRLALPAVWMIVLFYVAVRKVYDAKWLRALTSAVLGAAVFAVMFLVFLR